MHAGFSFGFSNLKWESCASLLFQIKRSTKQFLGSAGKMGVKILNFSGQEKPCTCLLNMHQFLANFWDIWIINTEPSQTAWICKLAVCCTSRKAFLYMALAPSGLSHICLCSIINGLSGKSKKKKWLFMFLAMSHRHHKHTTMQRKSKLQNLWK